MKNKVACKNYQILHILQNIKIDIFSKKLELSQIIEAKKAVSGKK